MSTTTATTTIDTPVGDLLSGDRLSVPGTSIIATVESVNRYGVDRDHDVTVIFKGGQPSITWHADSTVRRVTDRPTFGTPFYDTAIDAWVTRNTN